MKNIFLVDADDTVLDFHGSSERAIKTAFEKCNLEWRDEYLPIYRKVNAALWESLERKELSRDELMERRFPFFLSTLGIAADGKEFNRYYIDCLSKNPAYLDGAEDFLKALNELGRVYIVTNGTEYIQRSRFDIIGLWQYADGVFISQETGYDKPDPRYTQYITEHIENFDKRNAVWIGDSLSADIKGANDADIESIWFNPHGKAAGDSASPDHVAGSFEEILKILQIINR